MVDSSNNLKAPIRFGTFTELFNCQNVQPGNNDDWGHYFYYGSPDKKTRSDWAHPNGTMTLALKIFGDFYI